MASVPTTRHSSRNSTSPNSKRPVASPKTPVRASSKRSFAAVTPAALLAGSGSDVFQPSHSELTNSRSPKRRKMAAGTGSGTGQATIEVIDLTGDPPLRQQDDCAKSPTSSKRGKLTASPGQRVEKRLKRYRQRPPISFQERYERVMTQRMFALERTRGGTEEIPEETIEMAGTTGNVYHVHIGQVPSCSCPDHRKGNQCKHIIYALVNVLKAPEHLQYQLAFLSSELREIFAGAPPVPSDHKSDQDEPNNRKPIEGDCPICVLELEAEKEEIVWCKAACGNNIHKQCFDQWAASRRGQSVICVFCRTPWQTDQDSISTLAKTGTINEEGYVNVGAQLGLSGVRDTSTYHYGGNWRWNSDEFY